MIMLLIVFKTVNKMDINISNILINCVDWLCTDYSWRWILTKWTDLAWMASTKNNQLRMHSMIWVNQVTRFTFLENNFQNNKSWKYIGDTNIQNIELLREEHLSYLLKNFYYDVVLHTWLFSILSYTRIIWSTRELKVILTFFI